MWINYIFNDLFQLPNWIEFNMSSSYWFRSSVFFSRKLLLICHCLSFDGHERLLIVHQWQLIMRLMQEISFFSMRLRDFNKKLNKSLSSNTKIHRELQIADKCYFIAKGLYYIILYWVNKKYFFHSMKPRGSNKRPKNYIPTYKNS